MNLELQKKLSDSEDRLIEAEEKVQILQEELDEALQKNELPPLVTSEHPLHRNESFSNAESIRNAFQRANLSRQGSLFRGPDIADRGSPASPLESSLDVQMEHVYVQTDAVRVMSWTEVEVRVTKFLCRDFCS